MQNLKITRKLCSFMRVSEPFDLMDLIEKIENSDLSEDEKKDLLEFIEGHSMLVSEIFGEDDNDIMAFCVGLDKARKQRARELKKKGAVL